MKGQNSMVAEYLPTYPGTVINKEFGKNRLQIWEAHLQRISEYLEYGVGGWFSQDRESPTL